MFLVPSSLYKGPHTFKLDILEQPKKKKVLLVETTPVGPQVTQCSFAARARGVITDVPWARG